GPAATGRSTRSRRWRTSSLTLARRGRRQEVTTGCRGSILRAAAALVRERDRSVMGSDRIEIAVDDATQRGAVDALVDRQRFLSRRMLRQILGVVQIGGRPAGLARAAHARVIGAGDVPLSL